MPPVRQKRTGVALDMHGCPNRCRHCWLGSGSNRRLQDDDLRFVASQFRACIEGADSPVDSISVSSYFREPDFSDDYRHLHALAGEYGDPRGKRVYSTRSDLLSLCLGKHCEDTWQKRARSGRVRH